MEANNNHNNNSNRGARTVAEELERTEQSITLTLQEIDKNFAVANRIVAESILGSVERYGQECKDIWSATKFWKQFFETSANVSLSGYEELAEDDGDEEGQVNYHQMVGGGSDETTTTTTNTTTSAIIHDDEDDNYDNINEHHYHQQAATPQLKQEKDILRPKKEPLPLNVLNSSSFESTYEQSASNIMPPKDKKTSLSKSYYPLSNDLSSPPDTPPSLSDATQAIFSSKRPAGVGTGLISGTAGAGDSSQSISVSTPPPISSKLEDLGHEGEGRVKRPVETIFHALSLDNQSTPPATTVKTEEDSIASSFVSQKTPGQNKSSGDILLHHVLDKSWRLQVTPLKSGGGGQKQSRRPKRKSMAAQKYEDIASSSPPDVSPGFVSQVFSNENNNNNNYQQKATTTPLVRRQDNISSSIDIPPTTPRPSERYNLMYDDDDDDQRMLTTEPQFTPARQAAHLMVDNLLDTVRTATTNRATNTTHTQSQDPATMTSFLTEPSSLTAATTTTTPRRRDEDDVFN